MRLRTRPSFLESELSTNDLSFAKRHSRPIVERSCPMKTRSFVIISVVIAMMFGIVIVSAQPQDEDVRGAFLESRPKTTNLKSPSRRHRRPPATSNSNANITTATNPKNANTAGKPSTGTHHLPHPTNLTAIGLGYTMFMRE